MRAINYWRKLDDGFGVIQLVLVVRQKIQYIARTMTRKSQQPQWDMDRVSPDRGRQMMAVQAERLMASEPKLKRLISLARKRLKAKQVWIFGSRARGDAREDSDWDVFIVVPDSVPDYEFNPMVTWKIGRDAGLTADVVAEHEADVNAAANSINTLAYYLPREGVRIS